MNIPHNEQKHNNNQTSLQHIGNIAYHQGKSVTNYDVINSLTLPNKHYTLLYPDLVQELFNFSLHNSNSMKNSSLCFGGLGVNNTQYTSLDSSMSSSLDSLLSPRDILFFLQIVSLYQLELSKGNDSITYPSLKLAKLLGVDASCDTAYLTSSAHHSVNSLTDSNMRATILKMTAKLESLGLLKVFRRKRSNGMDLANKLVPVLPDRLYSVIKDSPTNLKVSNSSKLDRESNLEHILRIKLFVPIELEFMKSLFKNNLPSKYKLFFLNCIMSAYRNFMQNSNGSNMLSFSATSHELIQQNNMSKRTLFNIFKYIKQQGDSFFLKVEHKYTKSDDMDCNRYDKSIFNISINPLVFPISQIRKSQTEEITEFNHEELQGNNSLAFSDTYRDFREGVQKKQPISAKKAALNNKEEIIKNKYGKNIDYIDANSENSSIPCSSSTLTSEQNYKKEFFKDKQSLSSSESYNNSSFLNDSSSRNNKNISEQKEQWAELRHFYPLSEKDIDTLNFRAHREFSNNFVNQLLLKLYIKYPEKRFKNKFTFLSYMVQILKNEKHQGPLVNHTSFRFSCNIETIEQNLLKYEKYLNQIESSFDISKEMQVRKKIAGRFNTNVAYEILTQVEFKTNHNNSFITAIIPKRLDLGGIQTGSLSERQIEILSEQLEAVYGINGYYVTVVGDVGSAEDSSGKGERKEEIEKQYSKIKESDIISNIKDIGILDIGKELDKIEENTVWNQIRKGLREELGEAIDAVWFSKAEATEDKEKGMLILTMPTRFMADWVKNNYSHVLKRLSVGCGINRVEYEYEQSNKLLLT
nr:DnaA N-terminal domain-containing protein [Rickettsia africae]